MVVAFRYITKELLLVFVVVFVVVLSVVLSGRFISYLQDAAGGRYSSDVLLVLIGLRLPEFVQITGPLAFFMSLLLTYGRLHAEHEFTVLLSSGANPLRMLRWLLIVAVPLACGVGYLTFEITPGAKQSFEKLSLEQRVSSEFDAVTPGVFHDFSHGRRVSYVEAVDRELGQLQGVFLGERAGRSFTNVWADIGSLYRDEETGSRFMLLENGARFEGVPGQADYRVVKFHRLGQRVEREAPQIRRVHAATVATRDLDTGDDAHLAELHWRIGLPLMVIIGGICAFGLARVPPRSGRFGKVLPGVAFYLVYYLSLVFLKNALADGTVPTWLGLWPVHAGMLCAAVALVRSSYRPA